VVDFTPADELSGFRRLRQRILLCFLYTAFRATTPMEAGQLPHFRKPFQDAGWRQVEEKQSPLGLFTTTLWQKP
jgi:hypothetical protein